LDSPQNTAISAVTTKSTNCDFVNLAFLRRLCRLEIANSFFSAKTHAGPAYLRGKAPCIRIPGGSVIGGQLANEIHSWRVDGDVVLQRFGSCPTQLVLELVPFTCELL